MKTVTCLTTPTKLDDGGNRDFINIFNNGGDTIYLCYDSSAADAVANLTVNNGWPVPAGTWFAISNDGHRNVYNKPIYAVSDAGGEDIRVQGA